jgi:hypothetical protein
VVPANNYKIDSRFLETEKEVKEGRVPKDDTNFNQGSPKHYKF